MFLCGIENENLKKKVNNKALPELQEKYDTLLKEYESSNNNINNLDLQENNIEDEKLQFDNIIIEESEDKKIYKIVQYHLEKDKMKFIKKIYLKNFNRFIRSDPLFNKIKSYNVNKFDFFEEDNESEEDDNEKQFVDYVPNEMIGALEDQDDEMDEHIRELTEQRKK